MSDDDSSPLPPPIRGGGLLSTIALVDSGGHYHETTLDITHEANVTPEGLSLRVFLALRYSAGQLALVRHGLASLWSVTYLGNGQRHTIDGVIIRHGSRFTSKRTPHD